MEQLHVSEKKMEGYILLEVEGTVNSYTYTDFQDKVYKLMEQNTVCLDMSKVINLSSAGLGVLMSAQEAGEEKGNKLYILTPSDVVKAAIESTGFSNLFKLVASQEDMEL